MGSSVDGQIHRLESDTDVVLRTSALKKQFLTRRKVRGAKVGAMAVDGVDLSLPSHRTLGIVGESGSGKTTLARLLLHLIEPTSGEIYLDGQLVRGSDRHVLKFLRSKVQMVFQDPYSSFDPLATVGSSVAEPLQVHTTLPRSDRNDRVRELFDLVGLSPEHAARRPSELSGGQLQRAAIARALAIDPQVLLLDEAVSALDVSTQAQVVNLIQDVQASLGVACLFISHDLSVVRHVSDVIAVMYLGRIVESGPSAEIFNSPRHPYTQALLSAIPIPDPTRQRSRQRVILRGEIPSPMAIPGGCRFRTRCPAVMAVCHEVDPPAATTSAGSTVFCHLVS